jgi:hypothetical protein
LLLIAWTTLTVAHAQIATPHSDRRSENVDKVYKEGKALYEAKKYDAALPKLKVAAEKGKKGAQYRLARCYDKGHGVAENNAMAVKWYQKAAAQGHAKAQYHLGKAYLLGKKGLAVDKKKAKTLLTKALKDEEDGAKLREKLRKEAAGGDTEAKAVLQIVN